MVEHVCASVPPLPPLPPPPPKTPHRMYRLVPAASLLQHFASDRSHMRRPDGSWCAEPPPYPCITAAAAAAAADGSCTMNLPRYRDMACDVLQDTISVGGVQQQQQHSGCGAVMAAAAGAVPACSTLPCQPAHDLSGACAVGSRGDAGAGYVSNTQPPGAAAATAGLGSSSGVAAVTGGCVNHPPAQPLSPSAPAVYGTTVGEEHQCRPLTRPVTWSDVVQAAGRSRYGVVVHEHTLLRCLLGAGGAGDGVDSADIRV